MTVQAYDAETKQVIYELKGMQYPEATFALLTNDWLAVVSKMVVSILDLAFL